MKKLLIIGLLFICKGAPCQSTDTTLIFNPQIENDIKSLAFLDTIYSKSNIIVPTLDSGNLSIILIRAFNLSNNVIYEGKYLLSRVDTIRINREFANGERKKEIKGFRFIYLREGYWYNYRKKRMQSTYYFQGKKLKHKI